MSREIHNCILFPFLVEECIVNATTEKAAIYTKDVQQVTIKQDTINVTTDFWGEVKNAAKKIVGRKVQKPIHVGMAAKKTVEDNRITVR